eukprot:11219441-Lingulodinium_polyedra.AAC.1
MLWYALGTRSQNPEQTPECLKTGGALGTWRKTLHTPWRAPECPGGGATWEHVGKTLAHP